MKEVFDILYSNNKNISDTFDDVAYLIMNKNAVSLSNKRFKIVELEFYVKNSRNPADADLYTHGNEKQLKFGEWYDHPAGLDFTIGNNSDIYGGILIRSILDIETNEFINGPLNVKAHFVKNGYKKNDSCLKLIKQQQKEVAIYKAKRFGLPMKEAQIEFYNKKYRYITDFVLKNKVKAKEKILEELLEDNKIDWQFILEKIAISYVPGKLKEKYDKR